MIPVKETSFSLSIDMDHLMIGYGMINQIFNNFSLIVEGIVMFEVKGLVFLFNWKEW